MSSSILSLTTPPIGLGLGDANQSIRGTRESGPRGIETVLEYNGLYLNVDTWIDTYLVTRIDGIDDADVRDDRQENPGEDGETPFPGLYGGRTLVIQGKIMTRTIWKMRDMQKALRRAFGNIREEQPLYFRTNDIDTDMVIWCRKFGKIEMPDEQKTPNGFERPFQITLRASNPRFLSVREEFITTTVAGTSETVAAVNNGGDRAQPIYRVYGPIVASVAGGIGLQLINETNGEALSIKAKPGVTQALAANRFIEIDIAKRVMIEFDVATNVSYGNAFDRLHENSAWPELESGENNITVDYTVDPTPDPTFSLRFRHTEM